MGYIEKFDHQQKYNRSHLGQIYTFNIFALKTYNTRNVGSLSADAYYVQFVCCKSAFLTLLCVYLNEQCI
jgi:hypothetical protein